jgi:hypothetical protein
VRYSFFTSPATAKPDHRVEGRVGKPDAAARGVGVGAGLVDTVFGVAILPYCNVPGLKCARKACGAKPLNWQL